MSSNRSDPSKADGSVLADSSSLILCTGIEPVLPLGAFISHPQTPGLSSSVDWAGVCLGVYYSLFLSHPFLKFIIRAEKLPSPSPPHTT